MNECLVVKNRSHFNRLCFYKCNVYYLIIRLAFDSLLNAPSLRLLSKVEVCSVFFFLRLSMTPSTVHSLTTPAVMPLQHPAPKAVAAAILAARLLATSFSSLLKQPYSNPLPVMTPPVTSPKRRKWTRNMYMQWTKEHG